MAASPGHVAADEWLRSVGLEAHAAVFAAQDIGLAEIPELTEADLRELGLTIGERKRFRAAARTQLRQGGGVGSEVPQGGAAARTLPERRPLSVMFVDMVDSTGHSDRMEVEDLIETVRIYREFCDRTIGQFGGHVAQFYGDGIMAYFCYPVAHENDAERAVRAGLAIAAGVRGLATPAGSPIHVRVGIATGRVVISDLFSGASQEERKVSGATPNLAARLQTLAAPDGVVVSELTHSLVAPLFISEDAGRQEMRGFGSPQHVFHMLAARPETIANPTPNARLTPLYGREAELEALSACWASAAAGAGACAVITGEAGIGKSRLVERFLGAIFPGAARVVRVFASPFDSDSPLRPFLAHFRMEAGFSADDTPEERLARLAAILTGADRAADLAVMAELLRIRVDPALSALSPAALRERALAALTRQLLALAAGPLCLVVEDLHWLDPTSAALLSRLAAGLAGRRVMLLATSREDADAAPLPVTADRLLRLSRLEAGDVLAMVQALFGDETVPADIARQIAGKTDGIPLFVEEYVRPLLLANAGVDWSRVASQTMEGGAHQAVVIPTSLHESLMARLDRSGAAKEVAQIASVIGRVARRDVLAAAAGLPRDVLDQALRVLHETGVLHPESDDGRDCFAFGHALVRETAYDSILRDRRRELHGQVAAALLAMDVDGVELQPERLATHLTEAGQADQAMEYWLRASERSVRRSSLFEAVGLLRRALAACEGLEDTPERGHRRLQLMTLLGPALIAIRGPGSADAQNLYVDAYGLVEQQVDSRSHFPLSWGWWRVSRDYIVKRDRAATLLTRARRLDDDEMLLQAHHCNWAAHYELGDLCRCVEHVRAGMAVYGSGDFRHHASMYGNHDALVCAHGELSQVFWMQGRLQEALVEEARALDVAEAMGHLGSRVHAMDMALLHRSYQRDRAAVWERADRLIDFTAEHGMPDHRAKGLIFRGWATAMDGDAVRGIEAIRSGLARQREIGTIEDFPMYVAMLADALVAGGQPERAVEEAARARAEFDAVGLRIWLPEVLRQLGVATLAADPGASGAAAATLAEAAGIAGEQGACMLGLRIAVDRARLAQGLGDPERARVLLLDALGAMPPGHASAEAVAAASMLDGLADRLGAMIAAR